MNDIESQIYEEVLLASILDSVENGEGGNPNKGLFKRMQQACSDPLILLGPKEEHSPLASAYDKAATETMPNMQRIPTLSEFVKSADVKSPPAKVRTLLKALGVVRKKEPRAKFLIFTQWVTFAKSVAFHLKNSGSKIFSFTGALTPNEQEAGIQDFQSLTTKLDGMILTIGAGGEGLNLTAANHVFHLNPTWNPMKEMQGLFRAYRNKQLLPITVHFVRVPVRCGNGGVEPTIEYTIFKKAAIKTEWAEREAGRSAQTDRYELALWNEL
ncbi:hypothetical protein MMC30_004460 [Trapelia coarctata]|nr:hypothetical protein [Trapelia coarctata]